MKDYKDEEGLALLAEEKKFKIRKRKYKAACPHVSKKGKSLLRGAGEHVHECARCKTKIDLRPYLKDEEDHGVATLKEHVRHVRNALEICKYRAAIDGDNKNSRRILERCSAMILDLDSVPDLMEAMLENGESKKDKKRKKKQEIKLGLESLAFEKKKKNKGW